MMGHFVELPYTLVQDHTLTRTLKQQTPRLWLEKVALIRQYCGMALVNTHPDYLMDATCWNVYEKFLYEMRNTGGFWHALPCEVARWWRTRANLPIPKSGSTPEGSGVLQPSVGIAQLPSEEHSLHTKELLVLSFDPPVTGTVTL
jgi:hypothetical protein